MAINFPNTPVQGTTWTQGVNTWVYDGAKWNISPVTIQGVTGSQGIQGIQGISIQGIQGTQGLQGLQGIQGIQGFGFEQLQGIQGIQGFSIQGIQGQIGPSAVQFTVQGIINQLYFDETPSAVVQHTAQAVLKSYNLPANNYNQIKVEATIQSTNAATTANSAAYSWSFRSGNTVLQTLTKRLLSTTTTGGQSDVSTISTTIPGGSAASLQLTVQQTAAISTMTSQALSFRVYAIEDYTFGGQGNQGIQGIQGIQGAISGITSGRIYFAKG